jgi:hypothetical protein
MSYGVVQGGPKKRPGVVTAASSLLYFCAAVLVVTAVLSILQYGKTKEIAEEVFKDTPGAENAGSIVAISLIAGGVFYLLLAVGILVLGLLVRKGKQPARIITWVIAGLGVLCLGCGLASSGLTSSIGSTPESKELQDRLAADIPAWQTAVSTTLNILSVLALVAVIILLALPASNDYFRKEQEVWVPPTTFPQDMSGIPPLPPPPGSQPPYPGQYPPSQPPTYPPGQ